jgi:hypothetical protein
MTIDDQQCQDDHRCNGIGTMGVNSVSMTIDNYQVDSAIVAIRKNNKPKSP